MSKFEVIESKGVDTYNYGFDKLADAIAYADKDWDRLTYVEQSDYYEEFYILICEDPDEESLNHFNGDIFKDYKVDAELLALDISDSHTRVEVIRNDDIITIVDSIKDYIELRDNIYMSEMGAGYPFKNDIKFEYIKEREEPEKAEPVIDFQDLAFEIYLIKRAEESIIDKYGLEYFSMACNTQPGHTYKLALMVKNGIDNVIDLAGNEWAITNLKCFFERAERSDHHE